MTRWLISGLAAAVVMTACGAPEEPSATLPQLSATGLEPIIDPPATPPRWYKFEQVTQGKRLYVEHCASCHGRHGEGSADWRRRGPDGKLPPPPLIGTGHTWHHPLAILYRVIMHGSPGGQGNMPAWKDKLSRDEALSVIAWFQSRWPDKIYEAGYVRDLQARADAAGQ